MMNRDINSEVVAMELIVGAWVDVAKPRQPVAGIGQRMGRKGRA